MKIRASINKGNGVSHDQYLELPKAGMAAEEVKARLQSRVRKFVYLHQKVLDPESRKMLAS